VLAGRPGHLKLGICRPIFIAAREGR